MLIIFQTSIIGAFATTLNEEDAICQIRDNMINRNENFTIEFKSNNLDVTDLINKAMSEEYSNSNEAGDYLFWTYLQYNYEATNYESGKCVIDFDILYRTTREQEIRVSQRIANVVKEIGLNNGTDYEKIRKIHDYIIDIVTYDTSSLNCHTAYGALIEGKAACQGYALLFYRMCKEVGIDARIIAGNGHAWNIVKLDGVYYNIDCTWDDTNNIKTYTYFLKCDKDFIGHSIVDSPYTTNEFKTKYNKATKCYGGCAEVSGNSIVTTKNRLKITNKTKTSISKLTSGKKKLTVKWKKKSTINGYQIQYSTSSKFKSAKSTTVKGTKTTSKTIKGLKSKKKYYVRVRTYKTTKINGKITKVYSSWSKAKSVKVK